MRILAALSGGVDSAVAAARLRREGAEVVAVHLRTGVEAAGEGAGARPSCCGADDARDARAVAARLGLPFYVVDVADAFRRVLDGFAAGYAAGETPNPCVTCNREVKFGRLRDLATDLGCAAVATGHHARRGRTPGGRERLLTAADPRKDQTYVLHGLDQAQLAGARFPVGTSTKAEVREEARALGLPVADKAESQDLCFVPGRDYRRWLEAHAPGSLVPGPVLDESGDEVGRHRGAAGFTRGQRRGLPAGSAARYVTDVEAGAGIVRTAPRERLWGREVEVEDLNWIEEPAPEPGACRRVAARIRHAGATTAGTLHAGSAGRARLELDQPVFAPCPGQALVAYVGDAVLCGGRIVRAPLGAPAPDVRRAGP